MAKCFIRLIPVTLLGQNLLAEKESGFLEFLEEEMERFRVKPDFELAEKYERKGYSKEDIARLLEKQMELDGVVKISCIQAKYQENKEKTRNKREILCPTSLEEASNVLAFIDTPYKKNFKTHSSPSQKNFRGGRRKKKRPSQLKEEFYNVKPL